MKSRASTTSGKSSPGIFIRAPPPKPRPRKIASKSRSDLNLVQRLGVNLFDEIQGFDNFRQIFPWNIHSCATPQAQAKEDRVEVAFDFLDRDIFAHLEPTANLHAQALDHADLLQAHLRCHLVVGDAVGVEPAGVRFLFKNDRLMAELSQLSRTAQARRPAADDGETFS